jgi:eukaryotic-like serine/threonine-protein kinase
MLSPGELIDHYQVESSIGSGGMGWVYRALDVKLQRKVALKVIRKDDAADHGARLRREALSAASLNHPNIVSIFDVGETETLVFCAMELVTGRVLRDLIGNQEVPLSERIRWIMDTARALELAHVHGLVHRDIKPENIMLRDDGVIKVLDFGIARRVRGGEGDMITKRGEVIGTPAYMSPEQLSGEPASALADQFSWGVFAYEVLCGERPWQCKDDLVSMITAIVQHAPRPLLERVPQVPEETASLVMRALNKDPAERHPSMTEITRQLEFLSGTSANATDRIRVSHLSTPVIAAYAATTKLPTEIAETPSKLLAQSKRNKLLRRVGLGAAALVAAFSVGVGVRWKLSADKPAIKMCESPDANAKALRAVQLLRDGAEEKAMRELESALAVEPKCAAANLQAALLLDDTDPHAAQHYADAFEGRSALSPRDVAVIEAVEPYYSGTPDLGQLEIKFRGLTQNASKDPEAFFHLGRALELSFDYEGARDAYSKVIALDPNFARGYAARAQAQRLLGDTERAKQDYETCLARSPLATSCLAGRVAMDLRAGQCASAKAQAARWVDVDPGSSSAQAALARSLFAAKESPESVRTALDASWKLGGATDTLVEQEDRVLLLLQNGNFVDAERMLLAWEKVLPQSASRTVRATPALLRAELYAERGDDVAAAKVANEFLSHAAAWSHSPLLPDPSIRFLRFVDKKSSPETVSKRDAWLRTEQQADLKKERVRSSAMRWALMYGEPAETNAQAKVAVAKLTDFLPLPVEARRSPSFDYALGKAYSRADQLPEAKRELSKLTSACRSFDDPFSDIRARFELGKVLQALGEPLAAKALFEEVIAHWGKANAKSLTADNAVARLRTMNGQ